MAMASLLLFFGTLSFGTAMDDAEFDKQVTAAATSASPQEISAAMRLLENNTTLASPKRVDLLARIMTVAQERIADQAFVDKLVLGLFRSNSFQRLDMSGQQALALAVLSNEGMINRTDHVQNPVFAGDLTVELLRWLQRIDAGIDPKFNPAAPPTRVPDPPPGYDAGIKPADISDPSVRAAYERQWSANEAAIVRFQEQYHLRRDRRRCVELVVEHVSKLTPTKVAAEALRGRCQKAGLPPALISDVFEPTKNTPVPPGKE